MQPNANRKYRMSGTISAYPPRGKLIRIVASMPTACHSSSIIQHVWGARVATDTSYWNNSQPFDRPNVIGRILFVYTKSAITLGTKHTILHLSNGLSLYSQVASTRQSPYGVATLAACEAPSTPSMTWVSWVSMWTPRGVYFLLHTPR